MTSSAASGADWLADYQCLLHGACLFDLGHRTQIELTGADRASFMHNLCTNEVRRLTPGSGNEAFITSVQGKTLGHALIYVGPESIVVDTVPGEGEKLLKHLDRYLVCEQVTLTDRSQQWAELLLAGAAAAELISLLTGFSLSTERLANAAATIADKPVWLRRADTIVPHGILLSASAEDVELIRTAILKSGARAGGQQVFEAARIEHGFPLFGVDLTDANLPQELARDATAISFVKGCYLGQETVARIDALGHVNKSLVGIRMASAAPPAVGSELQSAGQVVGSVTSSTFSPKLGAGLALAYVRRGSNAPGTELDTVVGSGHVVALPVG